MLFRSDPNFNLSDDTLINKFRTSVDVHDDTCDLQQPGRLDSPPAPASDAEDADSGVSSNEIEEVFHEVGNSTLMAEHLVPRQRSEGIKRSRCKSQWLKDGCPGWLQRMEEKQSKQTGKQPLGRRSAVRLSPQLARFFIPA